MGAMTNTLRRFHTGEVRKEDDITPIVKDFFEGQEQVDSYQLNENNTIDVEGSIHIYYTEELGFKLGSVSGNVICHCKRIHPSQIPLELGGEIILDIESIQGGRSTNAGETPLGMEPNPRTIPDKASVQEKIENLISDCVEYQYDIDIPSIIERTKEEKLNSNKS